jgi:hypothetical protein
VVILFVGIYRALGMRRGFVDATYRSRALLSAILMSVVAISNAFFFVPLPNNALGGIVGFVPFSAIVGVCFALVDSNVLAAARSDFFHRTILHWPDLRLPAGAALGGSGVFILWAIASDPQAFASSPQSSDPFWVLVAYYQFFFIAAVVLGYGAMGLIIGSRRTPDRTLKKYIRLLGFALASFALSLVVFTASSSDATMILGDLLTLGATYVLYVSVMSLTSLGHVEKEVILVGSS